VHLVYKNFNMFPSDYSSYIKMICNDQIVFLNKYEKRRIRLLSANNFLISFYDNLNNFNCITPLNTIVRIIIIILDN